MALKKNTFYLDIGGGAGVLQDMSQDMVAASAKSICDRANTIYSKLTGHGTNAFSPTSVIVGKAPNNSPRSTPRAWVAVRTNAAPYKANSTNEALRKAVSAGKV